MPITANTTLAVLREISAARLDRLRAASGTLPPTSSSGSAPRRPRSTPRSGRLSGGNQQKVALARWLATEPIGAHPRRADAGRGRRRQGRDSPPHGRARAPRAGDPHDLFGASGSPRHERPDRGHARRARSSASRPRARRRRRSCSSWRSDTLQPVGWPHEPRISARRSALRRTSRQLSLLAGICASSRSLSPTLLLLALLAVFIPPSSASSSRTTCGQRRPAAGPGGRNDAGHPRPPDRHLDRLAVLRLRHRCRPARRRPVFHCRWSSPEPSRPERMLGAINGLLVARWDFPRSSSRSQRW